MKNPFARLLHHYTYNLKLKNKLVISHAILLMVPTAVVTGFLYARMYGIVMDDHHPLRAGPGCPDRGHHREPGGQRHPRRGGDGAPAWCWICSTCPWNRPGTHQPQRSRVDSLYRLASNLVDHSFITDIRIYYDDASYEDLSRYNQGRHPLFLPISGLDSPWIGQFESSSEELMLCPGELLSESETGECGGLASILRLSYSRTGSNVTVPPQASALCGRLLFTRYPGGCAGGKYLGPGRVHLHCEQPGYPRWPEQPRQRTGGISFPFPSCPTAWEQARPFLW